MNPFFVCIFVLGALSQVNCFQEFGSPGDFHPEIPLRSPATPVAEMDGRFSFKENRYTDEHNGVTHIFTQQLLSGVPIFNAVGNVNIAKNGEVISSYDRFANVATIGTRKDRELSMREVVSYFGDFVGYPLTEDVQFKVAKGYDETKSINMPGYAVSPVQAQYGLVQLEDRSLHRVWKLSIDYDDHWFEGLVCVYSGKVFQLNDLVHYYRYNVYPIGVHDPEDGVPPFGRSIEDELVDPEFSPLGWHDWGDGNTFSNTQGNNVRAQENWSGNVNNWQNNVRPEVNPATGLFDSSIDLTQDARDYVNASTTQLFYMNNMIHDIYYRHGFNEVSGNFQQNNFGRGGRGNDPVTAHCQDGSGFNNANFATPADGTPGRMRMYIYNRWNPRKDGDLDSGIVIHEYFHGISNRLTGGPLQTGCLSGGQPGGMGEGWGDMGGIMLRLRPEHTRERLYGAGEYTASNGLTVRKWPYSSNRTASPILYTYIRRGDVHNIVHATGTIWCQLLFEVYWDLVEAYGFDPDWLNGNAGNNMMNQIMIDGMKFQPCRPRFVDARDGILLSARETYGEDVYCIVYRGFASRGLGIGADGDGFVDSFEVPPQCQIDI